MALCARKIGNLWCIWIKSNGQARITIGPHWYLTLVLIVASIPNVSLVFYLLYGHLNSLILQIIGTSIIAFCYLMLATTALKNAGYEIPNSGNDLSTSELVCKE
jgi:hypothetical protein